MKQRDYKKQPVTQQEFADIMDEHQAMVYSIAYGLMRSPDLAKEVAQDAFVKVYFSLEKFDSRSKLSTWIYRIAYNTAISAKRKVKNEMVSLEDVNQCWMQAPTSDHDPQREQKLKQLTQILNSLKPEDSLIVNLYYYENHSIEDIAQIIGQSTSNTKVKLHRLRKRMQEMFNLTEDHDNETAY